MPDYCGVMFCHRFPEIQYVLVETNSCRLRMVIFFRALATGFKVNNLAFGGSSRPLNSKVAFQSQSPILNMDKEVRLVLSLIHI